MYPTKGKANHDHEGVSFSHIMVSNVQENAGVCTDCAQGMRNRCGVVKGREAPSVMDDFSKMSAKDDSASSKSLDHQDYINLGRKSTCNLQEDDSDCQEEDMMDWLDAPLMFAAPCRIVDTSICDFPIDKPDVGIPNSAAFGDSETVACKQKSTKDDPFSIAYRPLSQFHHYVAFGFPSTNDPLVTTPTACSNAADHFSVFKPRTGDRDVHVDDFLPIGTQNSQLDGSTVKVTRSLSTPRMADNAIVATALLELTPSVAKRPSDANRESDANPGSDTIHDRILSRLSAVNGQSDVIDINEEIIQELLVPVEFSLTQRSQERAASLLSDVAVTASRCKCKTSKCLKLYCTCFQRGVVCDAAICICTDCKNVELENGPYGARRYAIIEALSRRPDAFDARRRKRSGQGCSCRKNRCLQKYCDCATIGVCCSEKCVCINCANSTKHQKNTFKVVTKRNRIEKLSL